MPSVPNNNNFSLQNVYDSVRGHSPATVATLSSCFSNSVLEYFDPIYNDNSYAPVNSMKRFRNYGFPEFVGVRYNVGLSKYEPVLIYDDGAMTAPTITTYDSLPLDPHDIDYDPVNRVLLYVATTTYLTAFYMGDKFFQFRAVTTANPYSVNRIKGINSFGYTGSYLWVIGKSTTSQGYFGPMNTYTSLTAPATNLISGTPPTTGIIRDIAHYDGKYYYTTFNGEAGGLVYSGGGASELFDIVADGNTRYVSALNGQYIVYGRSTSCRSGNTATPTVTTEFTLPLGFDVPVDDVVFDGDYDPLYAYCAAGGSAFKLLHTTSSTPVVTNITPTGYLINNLTMVGIDLYASASMGGNYYILKSIGTHTTASWTVYRNIGTSRLYKFWKY